MGLLLSIHKWNKSNKYSSNGCIAVSFFAKVIHFIISVAVCLAIAASGDGRSNPLSSSALRKVPEM